MPVLLLCSFQLGSNLLNPNCSFLADYWSPYWFFVLFLLKCGRYWPHLLFWIPSSPGFHKTSFSWFFCFSLLPKIVCRFFFLWWYWEDLLWKLTNVAMEADQSLHMPSSRIREANDRIQPKFKSLTIRGAVGLLFSLRLKVWKFGDCWGRPENLVF